MTNKKQRIILYARHHRANQGVSETLQRLIDFAVQQKIAVFLDIDTATSFALSCKTIERHAIGTQKDLIIVVGGDGSLLSASQIAITANVPVIGINRGHLGFLTDISPINLEEQLESVLHGNYIEEQRFLLRMKIYDEHSTIAQSDALNDIVLSRGNVNHLIAFDVYINQQFVSHYRADGLILSTPTGSTAYALSAGGPIMHPQLNAIVMVPMFSHSLSSRPLVIDANANIVLAIDTKNDSDLQISCDGHESHSIKPGQKVSIEKSPLPLRLLHPCEYNYYDTLRIKLGWGAATPSSEPT